MQAIIHTDGGARGNPGPAAIGFTIESGGRSLARVGRIILPTTNNQAEYQAIIDALEEAQRLGVTEVELIADTELVVRQLRGEYKVKNKDLAPLFLKATQLIRSFRRCTLRTIPREQNIQADELVNQALDGTLTANN